LSELEKGKKYDMLYKKRRQLNRMIEDQPQRIIIQQESSESLPTSGVVPNKVQSTHLQKIQQNAIGSMKPDKKSALSDAKNANAHNTESTFQEEISDDDFVDTDLNESILSKTQHTPDTTPKKYSTSIRPNIIKEKYLSPLKKFISINRERLGITPEGKIFRQMNDKNAVKDSDINSALSYLAGGKTPATPGILYLYHRLSKEPEFREMVEKSGSVKLRSQKGQGIIRLKKRKALLSHKPKKYIIEKINLFDQKKYINKTQGLNRIKFKPKQWVKIGI
jgi:hypothetical protein